MSHTKFRHALFLIAVLTTLAACSGGGDNNNNNGRDAMEVPEMPDPAPDPQTDFSEFVIGLFSNTADTTDPVPVNDVDFSFGDQKNQAAFDALLE